jgi:hypothetical protein
MRIDRSSRGWAEVTHRYFPEWADRPARKGVPRESDRNSYMAGGYAEEFGYRTQPGLPAPAPPLAGDPERSRQWRAQIGALHPGYPECAKPLDRDFIQSQGAVSGRARDRAPGTPAAGTPAGEYPGNHTGELSRKHLPNGTVIRVGEYHRVTMSLPARLMHVWKVLQVGRRHLAGF